MLVVAFFNSIGLSGPLLLGTDALIGLINALTRSSTFTAWDCLTSVWHYSVSSWVWSPFQAHGSRVGWCAGWAHGRMTV